MALTIHLPVALLTSLHFAHPRLQYSLTSEPSIWPLNLVSPLTCAQANELSDLCLAVLPQLLLCLRAHTKRASLPCNAGLFLRAVTPPQPLLDLPSISDPNAFWVHRLSHKMHGAHGEFDFNHRWPRANGEMQVSTTTTTILTSSLSHSYSLISLQLTLSMCFTAF